jgi:NADH-quinone oxidoreductase subunit J
MQTLLLDLFATVATTCAMGVIVSTNSIHSVISSILVFCNATGLLLVLTPKIESIAIMFLIIYVGAIAVLFLFVVMMLNVREADTNSKRLRYFAACTLCISAVPYASGLARGAAAPRDSVTLFDTANTQALGHLIYTYYFYFLLMAGLILLVAMIGAIVLTMHKRKNASKKQFIFEQVARRFEDAIYYAS